MVYEGTESCNHTFAFMAIYQRSRKYACEMSYGWRYGLWIQMLH